MNRNSEYMWVPFYMEFADKLKEYINNRPALIDKIKSVYNNIGMKLPKLEQDGDPIDIDPFTVFGLFNKQITDSNRISIITEIAKVFSVSADIPKQFDGIPVLNPQRSTFYWFADERGRDDINNLWQVFISALEYAEHRTKSSQDKFCYSYDTVLKQKGIKWNITMGLFWIRPYTFLNLDSVNRDYLKNSNNMPVAFAELANNKLNDVPSAEDYLKICDECQNAIKSKSRTNDFPKLSHFAWMIGKHSGWTPTPKEYDPEISVDKWLLSHPRENRQKNRTKTE